MKLAALTTLLAGVGALAIPFGARDNSPASESAGAAPSGAKNQAYPVHKVVSSDLSLNTTTIKISLPVAQDQGDVEALLQNTTDVSSTSSAPQAQPPSLIAAGSNGTLANATADGDAGLASNSTQFDDLGDDTADGCDDSEEIYEEIDQYFESHNGTALTTNGTIGASLIAGDNVTDASGSDASTESSDECSGEDDEEEEDDDDDEDECSGDDDQDEDEDDCSDDDDDDDDINSVSGNTTLSVSNSTFGTGMRKRLSSTVNATFGPGTDSQQMKDGESAGAALKAAQQQQQDGDNLGPQNATIIWHSGKHGHNSTHRHGANASEGTTASASYKGQGSCRAKASVQTIPTGVSASGLNYTQPDAQSANGTISGSGSANGTAPDTPSTDNSDNGGSAGDA